jgi:hypothetical protein
MGVSFIGPVIGRKAKKKTVFYTHKVKEDGMKSLLS